MYEAFCKGMSAHELKYRLMVMNHGTEAHMIAFRYFGTKIKKKKNAHSQP